MTTNTRDQRRRTHHHAVDRIGSNASAQSQDDNAGRAKALSAARDQKSEQLTPPERSLTERALHWYDNHDSRLSWRGLHVNMGNFSGGAGFAGGIGLTQRAIGQPVVDPYQANRIDLDLSAGRSILGYQRLAARVDVLNIAGAPINFAMSWRDDQMPQEDFYGIGPDADHRVSYRLDTTDTTAALEWKPFRQLSIGGAVALLTPVVRTGNRRTLSVDRNDFRSGVRAGAQRLARVPAHRRDRRLRLARQLDASAERRKLPGHRIAVRRQASTRSNDFRRVDVSAAADRAAGNRYRRIELRAPGGLHRRRWRRACPVHLSAGARRPVDAARLRDGRFRDRHAVAMSRRISMGSVVGARRRLVRRRRPGRRTSFAI